MKNSEWKQKIILYLLQLDESSSSKPSYQLNQLFIHGQHLTSASDFLHHQIPNVSATGNAFLR